MPELKINTSTWTRESHGLYDYEGTEIEKKAFKIKGNIRVQRFESDVRVTSLDNANFEKTEETLPQEEKDKIVARLMIRDGNYWIYHKNMVDESID